MNIFAMVSMSRSERYTDTALQSFFEHTRLEPGDRFFLIDNDASLRSPPAHPGLTFISNPTPKSFAANVNQILHLAAQGRADVYFLNNDLVFTPSWLEPLLVTQPAILSPFSNREFVYTHEEFSCERTLDLEQYRGHEADLIEIAARHRSRYRGYYPVLSLPFFCVKLPYAVYSVVGDFDESFGRGGAEDNDYCLRTHLAGFQVGYAQSSYILHFNGKSTWSGAETPYETDERCRRFRHAFERKWGKKLLQLIIDFDNSILHENSTSADAARRADFRSLIEALVEKNAPGAHSARP